MSDNPFLTALSDVRDDPSSLKEALRVLDELCAAVAAHTAGVVECKRIPGVMTSHGLEQRLILFQKSTQPEHTLFLRAYVPTNGFPVELDT